MKNQIDGKNKTIPRKQNRFIGFNGFLTEGVGFYLKISFKSNSTPNTLSLKRSL
jgi:hypothetical protein